ncbi:ImmA/IrrE family metallo-endopeptidase [Thermoanaerobacterium thermosaccharolyticum]|uniref:ImmA/IrrE family metallo-endopeptidase n=1 Tax=Thermoanaerobacterium thermosaccharolyticum TaxID=1517 RepID=UPI003D2AA164
MNIKEIAEEIYNTYHTRNPYEIADYMNGIILYTSYLPDDIYGMSNMINNTWIISINSKLHNYQVIKFTIAHEIGHKVLHDLENDIFFKRNTCFSLQKFDNQADEFALNLLYTDDDLRDIIEYCSSDFFCDVFKIKYTVFEKVIKERLGV